MAAWFYLAGSICFLIGSAMTLAERGAAEDAEEEERPWGFNVARDGGVVDGGNYDGWEED